MSPKVVACRVNERPGRVWGTLSLTMAMTRGGHGVVALLSGSRRFLHRLIGIRHPSFHPTASQPYHGARTLDSWHQPSHVFSICCVHGGELGCLWQSGGR